MAVIIWFKISLRSAFSIYVRVLHTYEAVLMVYLNVPLKHVFAICVTESPSTMNHRKGRDGFLIFSFISYIHVAYV